MELLREAMHTSFALISSKWTVAQARRFLRGLDYTHVIIRRVDPPAQHYYYLHSGSDADAVLKQAPAEQTVHHVFDLREDSSTDALPSDSPADQAPARTVALDPQGEVAGFLDRTASWSGVENRFNAGGERPPVAEAYPTLDAPDRVAPSSEYEVHVGFSAKPDERVAQTGKMVFHDVQPDEKCHVVLVADGVTVDRLYADLPVDMAARATFRCKALDEEGVATLKAQYFFRNQLVGVAVRHVAIGAAKPTDEPQLNLMGFPDPKDPLDMTVTVNYLRDGRLQWSWTAPQPVIQATDFSTNRLDNAAQFAAGLVRELEDERFEGELAANVLYSKGKAIAKLIPEQFFKDLWRVYDAVGRLPTLLLLTNEIYVPWELACVPDLMNKDLPEFLAAQTCMGRWVLDPSVAHPPAAVVEIQDSVAVAAEYTDNSYKTPLKEALAERAYLAEKWKFAALEADYDQLLPYAKSSSCKERLLMHFAMHGLSDPLANVQALILKDGRRLSASALAGKPKSPPRFAFVFLNACQVGMAGSDFCQAAGFPGELVGVGALGFIAPLWVVDDGQAFELAKRFYHAVLDDHVPVGQALQAERARYQAEGPTTPLAYVYYGNPALRLQYNLPST